jgi:hypothetical protein
LPSSSSTYFYNLTFSFSKLAAKLVMAYLSFLFCCFNSSVPKVFRISSCSSLLFSVISARSSYFSSYKSSISNWLDSMSILLACIFSSKLSIFTLFYWTFSTIFMTWELASSRLDFN